MDPSNQDGADDTTVARRCKTCQLTAHVAVAMTTAVLVTGFLLILILIFAVPGEDQTSGTSIKEMMVVEKLHKCENQRRDLNLMLQNVTQDSRCSLCPDGWMWWRSRCYFFSVGLQENRRWNESADFCKQHSSHLVVIETPSEMDFLQDVMMRFPHFPFLWVGLTDSQQEGRWMWGDGADLQDHMSLVVEWDVDHRDCADLRGGGRVFAASCDEYGPWVCERDA